MVSGPSHAGIGISFPHAGAQATDPSFLPSKAFWRRRKSGYEVPEIRMATPLVTVTGKSAEVSVQTPAERARCDDLLVTVITPTRNQACYIAQCVESVLGQTHRNIQYLIYDACSTDDTDKVLARYIGDPRIVYRREPDGGQSDAINKGLEAARGDIVCWLNSDDFFFDCHVLAKVCGVFAANAKIDVVTGDGYLADADGTLAEPIVVADASRISHAATRIADNFLQPATFWRRNEVRLDNRMHFVLDWRFFLDLYRTGRSFHYLPEYLAVYRLHDAGKTTQDSAARKREVCEMLGFAGAGPVPRAWAWLIYRLYALSEVLQLPAIKWLARSANIAMWYASMGRIFSC
jgi:glycosyltransferase involved in cell wall biosynthesis